MASNPITGRKRQVSKMLREKSKSESTPFVDRRPRKKLKTRRYCIGCGKMTTFELNAVIGHSRCTECTGYRATRVERVNVIKNDAVIEKRDDIVTSGTIDDMGIRWLKFVKIPIVIEAFMTTKELKIKTLEGVMIARRGDWIVKGISGEIYPVRHSIFEKTYQRITVKGVDENGNET